MLLRSDCCRCRLLQSLNISSQHYHCHNSRNKVANGLRIPHTIGLIEVGQDYKQRQEKQQLARERQKHAHLCLAYTLEESRTHHLHTHYGEHKHDDTYGMFGDTYQRLVGGKESGALIRYGLGNDEARGGYAHGNTHGVLQRQQQTIVVTRTVVVAGNGEHALVHTHINHHEDESYLIADAEGSYCHIATMAHQSVVDEDDDDTRADVHGKRRYAYCQNVLHYMRHGAVDATTKVDYALGIAEYAQLPCQHCGLGNNSSKRCSAYAHVERPDEYRRQYGIENYGHDGCHHSRTGFGSCSQYGVHAEEHVRDSVAGERYYHILAKKAMQKSKSKTKGAKTNDRTR